MEIVKLIKGTLESFKELDHFHAAILFCILALCVVALSLAVLAYAIKRLY